jgi:predicted membrane chloride channel (bestrophin family)
MASKRNKQRTYARNRVFSRTGRERLYESDGRYFLKLVLVVILGTLWLKFKAPFTLLGIPFYGVPVGMLFGLLLVSRFERFQYDRKIWYAILVLVTILSFFVPAGILI